MDEGVKGENAIAAPRDGKLMMLVSASRMEVFISIVPPSGGEPVDKERVYLALREKGVACGILHDQIESAVGQGAVNHFLVARGKEPAPGSDSRFISLIPEMRERTPHVDEQDVVDFHNLGGVIGVKPGDPLVRREPPTSGEPGENVLGEVVAAVAGKDIPFAPNLKGVRISPDDPDLLLADLAGQPVLVSGGAVVEPVLKLQGVDLSTGNICFTGTVHVAGDVIAGMEIKADGDVIVGGVVEAAKVTAGGDIEVRGGIVGHGELRRPNGELSSTASLVSAMGTIKALYVENSCLEASDSIFVADLVMQSDLSAGNRIVVGRETSSKGNIVGGVCRASTLARAAIVGSVVGVTTLIEAGVDPYARRRLEEVDRALAEKEKLLAEQTKTLSYLHSAHRDDADSVRRAARLQDELEKLRREKKRLKKRLEPLEWARIKVLGKVYCGTRIMVGDKRLDCEDDMEGGDFRLVDGAVES